MARYGDPYANLWSDEDLARMRDNALAQWSENRAPEGFHDGLIWAYIAVLERALIDTTTTTFIGRERLPLFSQAVRKRDVPKVTLPAIK